MFSFLLKIFIILITVTSNICAEIINKVEVIGNKRISSESIMVLGGINLGDDYDAEELNNSIKKLYETNFFNNINISQIKGYLEITVTENPIIESIEVSGIKKNSFVKNIKENLSLKNRMSFTEDQFKKDLNLLNSILKSSGYYFSRIKTTQEFNNELNSIKLFLDIDLGKKAKIKEIIFLGDKKVKDKKLIELIASEEHKFWKVISKKVYLNQSLVNLDKRLLKNYYLDNGYYDVKVLNSFAEINKEGFFKLVYNISSGKKYFFNNFSLNLPPDYSEKDFKKLTKVFNKLKGEKYSLNSINLILNEIDEIASSRLYDFIKADVKEEIVNDNQINFDFVVTESDKFYVEKINVLGNYNTVEDVIRDNLIVDEGDPYNELLFNKSINKLRSLGIFKTVNSKINNGSTDNFKSVDIEVEEKATGEISLGAGIGTDGGVLGGGISERNFLGKGITLNTNLEITESSIKGSLTYAKPYYNYTDNTLFTTIKSTTADNLTDFGYKVNTTGMSLGTKTEAFEDLYFSPEIDVTFEDLETNSNASNNLRKQDGTYKDLYFNYALSYDNRNSSYNPSKGNYLRFYQTLPIASTNNEFSNTLTFTQYKPLNSSAEMVGSASFYFKTITSLDGSDVRISKRGKIPYKRLRGFKKGKIGPIENNDYIGGNYVSALNLSTNLPGLLSSFENLDLSYFLDFANIWGVDYDDSIDDASGLRSSTGLALEFLSPVGPLSFSLAHPITKKSTDQTESFRFNLGTTF